MKPYEILKEKKKYRIFVVEDSDAYRTLIVEFLTRLRKSVSSDGIEYTVKGFSSGEACVANLHQKPDIIILDYFLDSAGFTGQTGLATLNQIKQECPKTDVVILSCQNNINVIKALLESGAKEYVNKGNSAPIKIYDIVSDSIRKKERNRELIRSFQIAAAGLLLIFASVEIARFLAA